MQKDAYIGICMYHTDRSKLYRHSLYLVFSVQQCFLEIFRILLLVFFQFYFLSETYFSMAEASFPPHPTPLSFLLYSVRGSAVNILGV